MCTPCFIYITMSPRLFYKSLGGIHNDHKNDELMHVCISNINTNQLLCKPQKRAQILHFSTRLQNHIICFFLFSSCQKCIYNVSVFSLKPLSIYAKKSLSKMFDREIYIRLFLLILSYLVQTTNSVRNLKPMDVSRNMLI